MKNIRCGVVAKKVGMSRVFLPSGEAIPVTLLSLEKCSVVSIKEKDEHKSIVQVGSGAVKKLSKPLQGYFDSMQVEPRKVLKEFVITKNHSFQKGEVFQPDYFSVGGYVDVTGVTIGRGFAGGMKRHNFGGLRASHGVSVSHRSLGSTGHRKDPAKVFKGKKMPGHMGCVKVTVQSLKVMDVDNENGVLVVKGCVPGFDGGWVSVRDAVKK